MTIKPKTISYEAFLHQVLGRIAETLGTSYQQLAEDFAISPDAHQRRVATEARYRALVRPEMRRREGLAWTWMVGYNPQMLLEDKRHEYHRDRG